MLFAEAGSPTIRMPEPSLPEITLRAVAVVPPIAFSPAVR